jgi:hypothetical protein
MPRHGAGSIGELIRFDVRLLARLQRNAARAGKI